MTHLEVDAVCRWGVGPTRFVAEQGTFVAITGEPGAGKSSLIGVLAGFDRADSGRVLLAGEDIHEMPRARLESRVAWFGGVIPHIGRAQRMIPPLVVGDEPSAPFTVVLEQAANVFVAVREQQRLDSRLTPLLATVRFLCDRGAVVVIATHHPVVVKAADMVVGL